MPRLLLNPDTGAWQAVYHNHPPGFLGYLSAPLAPADGTSRMAQAVSIPVDVTAPTLSFLVRAGGLGPEHPFRVTVTSGGQTTPVYTLAGSSLAWSHAWADLGAWTGQTVTVTFEVSEAAGQAGPGFGSPPRSRGRFW